MPTTPKNNSDKHWIVKKGNDAYSYLYWKLTSASTWKYLIASGFLGGAAWAMIMGIRYSAIYNETQDDMEAHHCEGPDGEPWSYSTMCYTPDDDALFLDCNMTSIIDDNYDCRDDCEMLCDHSFPGQLIGGASALATAGFCFFGCARYDHDKEQRHRKQDELREKLLEERKKYREEINFDSDSEEDPESYYGNARID